MGWSQTDGPGTQDVWICRDRYALCSDRAHGGGGYHRHCAENPCPRGRTDLLCDVPPPHRLVLLGFRSLLRGRNGVAPGKRRGHGVCRNRLAVNRTVTLARAKTVYL